MNSLNAYYHVVTKLISHISARESPLAGNKSPRMSSVEETFNRLGKCSIEAAVLRISPFAFGKVTHLVFARRNEHSVRASQYNYLVPPIFSPSVHSNKTFLYVTRPSWVDSLTYLVTTAIGPTSLVIHRSSVLLLTLSNCRP